MDKKDLIYDLTRILKSEIQNCMSRPILWHADYENVKYKLSLIQDLDDERRRTIDEERQNEKKSS